MFLAGLGSRLIAQKSKIPQTINAPFFNGLTY